MKPCSPKRVDKGKAPVAVPGVLVADHELERHRTPCASETSGTEAARSVDQEDLTNNRGRSSLTGHEVTLSNDSPGQTTPHIAKATGNGGRKRALDGSPFPDARMRKAPRRAVGVVIRGSGRTSPESVTIPTLRSSSNANRSRFYSLFTSSPNAHPSASSSQSSCSISSSGASSQTSSSQASSFTSASDTSSLTGVGGENFNKTTPIPE